MTETSLPTRQSPTTSACVGAAAPRRIAGRVTMFQAYGICLAMFAEGVSASSMNVQIAAIRSDLVISSAGVQLVATGFLVAYAGLLLPAGRLVDRFDRRRIFLLGLGLFAVGSVLGAVAPGVGALVLARVVQGAGAAITAPAALALVTQGLPPGALRNKMVALYGSMGAVGFSAGLVVPGFVVAQYGWRSSFLVLVPCVVLVSVAAWRAPSARFDDGSGATAPPPDWAGSAALLVLIGGGTFLVGGTGLLSRLGVVLVSAVVLGALIVVVVRRRTVLPPALATAPRVRAAALALGCLFAGVLSSTLVLTLALQDWFGLDPFTTGLLILPQPAWFALLARFGARWAGTDRWRAPLLTGLLLVMLALAGLGVVSSLVESAHAETTVSMMAPAVLVAMALVGTGMALVFPAASIAALNAVPETVRGSTSAALTTAQNVGGTLGIAVVTGFALLPEAGAAETGTMSGSLLLPLLVSAAITAIGCGAAATRRIGRSSPVR